MRIKSIKLTNEQEIKNSENPNAVFIGYSTSPLYQIEYEETTPTGLVAKGTMELQGSNLDKVIELFSDLEKSLTEENIGSEPEKETVGDSKKNEDEPVDWATNLAASFGMDENFFNELQKMFNNIK